MAQVKEILTRYPEVSCEEINYNPPSWCEPYGPMAEIIRANAKALKGINAAPIVSLGGTDARLWRYRNVPAYVYGPFPRNMGAADEYVEVEEFLHIVKDACTFVLRLSS